MKRIILGVGLFILCMRLCAQQEYFIFIEQGSGMPFYARIGEKNFSSSSSGHLIISSLKDTVYAVYIGFPRNQYPEQLFSIAINRKDRGFDLDNKEGKGWILTDLQSLQTLKPAAAADAAIPGGSKKTDTYSQLMAGVVDDSAVLYASAARVELPVKKPLPAVSDTIHEQEKKPAAGLVVNISAQTPAKKQAPEGRDSARKEPATLIAVKTDSSKNKMAKVAADTSKDQKQVGILPALASNAGNAAPNALLKDSVRKEPAKLVALKTDSGKNKMAQLTADSAKEQKEVAVAPAPVARNAAPAFVLKDSGGIDKPVKVAIARADTVLAAAAKKDIGISDPVKKDTAAVSTPKPDTAKRKEESTAFTILRDSQGRPVGVRQPVTVKPVIVHMSSTSVPDGRQLVYIDQVAGKADTITIVIPAGEAMAGADTLKSVNLPKAAVINNQCRDVASETDVDKLRIKLLAGKTEENKLIDARIAFSAKCYTTRQIRALSELFAGDQGRYQLLDAARLFLSDPGNFGTLSDLLKEDYYINRFKSLVSR